MQNERTGCTQVDNEVLDALIEASDEKYILCTIIKRMAVHRAESEHRCS